jgi:hypothetical protein|tara:strand:+ start:610 stop:849 length:240 start_codon:yes stop_codon:yes gene_type:complete
MIIETKEYANGVQVVHEFPNGYGASVVKHDYSYGGKDGLWEMAVLKEGELCYNTHITNDVIGYLSDADVKSTLKEIEQL